MQDDAKTRFQRIVEDLRYFAQHPREAMRFHNSWAALCTRLETISSTSHDMRENVDAFMERQELGRPSNDEIGYQAEDDDNWCRILLTSPDHAARCALCGQVERTPWEHRLRGTRIYSCEVCMKRPDKRPLVIKYCIAHPEAIPTSCDADV